MTCAKIEIDQVKPFCLLGMSKNDDLKEVVNWKKTETLLKEFHQQKEIKYKFLDFQLHFIKPHQFMKSNDQEGLNEDFH